jgi:hypothetical protein
MRIPPYCQMYYKVSYEANAIRLCQFEKWSISAIQMPELHQR